MFTIVALFLAGMFIAGLLILVSPSLLLETMENEASSSWLRSSAIFSRLILGVSFIVVAPETQLPTLIYVIGTLALVAAMVFAVMPKENFAQLISWASGLPHWLARTSGALVIVLVWFLALLML